MTREEEERECREARTTADVMARLERIAVEVQRTIADLVTREGLGMVLVLVDPSAPPGMKALIGGGNLTIASQLDALETYARMMRRAGVTERDKVRTPGIRS